MMNEKGFSPVIAVVLMVAVAVAAAVIAYLWGIGLLSGTQAGTQEGEISEAGLITIETIDPSANIIFVRCHSPSTTVTLDSLGVAGTDGVNIRYTVTASKSCSAGSTSLVTIDGDSDTSPAIDVNSGNTVTVRGTNNAVATKTV